MSIVKALLFCWILNFLPHLSFSQNKPNIIFILADDLGYADLGCYGQAKIKTPNIDKLAQNGIRFTNFYAGSTVCAPSRASLMTGQHTGHVSVRGNGEAPLLATDTIIPQMLKAAGYTNGMVGKWGLGLKGTTGEPERKGWDFFAGHLYHIEGHFQKPDSAWFLNNGHTERVAVPKGKYINEWFTDNALSFLQKNKSNPFFLYVSFTLPHAELVVPDNYLKMYLNTDGTSKFGPEKEWPTGRHYGAQKYPKAAYAAMVSQMDDYVGRIIALLKKLGIDKKTLVIFASDNGTHVEGGRSREDVFETFKSSGALKGLKRDLYEGGIRVPFIASWRGKIPKGSITNFSAAFWDLRATFAQLTNSASNNKDGISFLPTMIKSGLPQPEHKYFYWEFYENGFKQAVIRQNWKAIRFYKNGKPLRTELYNLHIDMPEKNDVADKNPLIVSELEAIMDQEHVNSDNPLFQVK